MELFVYHHVGTLAVLTEVTFAYHEFSSELEKISNDHLIFVLLRILGYVVDLTSCIWLPGRSLPVLCVHLFHWYGLLQHFNLDVVTVWKLFGKHHSDVTRIIRIISNKQNRDSRIMLIGIIHVSTVNTRAYIPHL